MIYIIKNKLGNIIAFSDNLEYIYHYLQDYYHRDFSCLYNYDIDEWKQKVNFYKNSTKLELSIEELSNQLECCEVYCNYNDFEIIPFYGDLLLTVWECRECMRMFEEYRMDLYEYIRVRALKYIKKSFGKIDNDRVDCYLKQFLGKKYNSLINQERFMMELGIDKIRELVNGFGLSLDIYYMNMDYKRTINDDK